MAAKHTPAPAADEEFSVGGPAQGSADESGVHTPAPAGSTPAPAPKSPQQIEREKELAEEQKLRAAVSASHDDHFRVVAENAARLQLDNLCRQYPAVALLRDERDALAAQVAKLKPAK